MPNNTPNANKPDLETLIQAVLNGNLDAYGRIVHMFQTDVWLLLSGILLNRESTRDMVQETFIKAYSRLDQYRPGTSFRAWLLAIARNNALNEIRAGSRRTVHMDRYREQYLAETEVVAPEPAADDLRLAALRECMKALPDHLRELLNMTYSQSLPLARIAERFRRSVEAVRQLQWRLRCQLRDCINRKTAQET